MRKKEEQLDFFFKRISVKMQKSPDDFEPFIQILKENWYDSAGSLIGLTDSDYQKMKIPYRVVTAIREQLSAQDTKPQQQKPTHPVQQNPPTIKKSLTQTSMTQMAVQLESGLSKQLQNVKYQVRSILQILFKILTNISKDPYEVKFRTLKKSNDKIKQNITQHPSCMAFMQAIGFQDKSEALQMKIAEVHHLLFILDCLDEMIVRNGGSSAITQQKKFEEQNRFLNVTEFPKDQTGIKQQFSEQKLSEMRYADALDKLMQFRNKIMSEPLENRRVRIYHKKHEIKNISVKQVNFEQEFEKSDDKIVAGYWKQAMADNAKSQKFQSKRKTQFQFLISQKVHREAVIKIKMPNQLIIEAYFGPLETLQTVFDLVAQIVIGDLYLFTTPPPKRMDSKNMKMTLMELESVPMGSFYLGCNNEYYIAKNYTQKIQK